MKKNKEENNKDFENLAKQVEIFKESFDGAGLYFFFRILFYLINIIIIIGGVQTF